MKVHKVAAPADLDAERVVLASILVDGDTANPSLRSCSDLKLSEIAFYEPKHQIIYRACMYLSSTGTNPDELTVADYLRSTAELDQAGGVSYLSELGSSIFTPSINLKPAVEIIKDRHKSRALLYLANDLAGRAASGAFKASELSTALLAQARVLAEDTVAVTSTEFMQLDELRSFDRNNDPNNLLGKRWICKGGSLLFSGQAGAGKSSLVMQMIISWSLGIPLWGIAPVKPMRIVLVQSENDGGDLAEQIQDCIRGLNLTAEQIDTVKENVAIYREAVKTGDEFGVLIEDLVKAHRAQLLFCDPILGFAGGDVSKQEFCSHFLRHVLQPVLMRTGVALIAIHHQNKPSRKKDENNSITSTYDFTGSSELANWFRSTAILRREDNEKPNFIFKLGKRGNRAGMKDAAGNYTDSLRICHSKVRGEIKWELNTLAPNQEADL